MSAGKSTEAETTTASAATPRAVATADLSELRERLTSLEAKLAKAPEANKGWAWSSKLMLTIAVPLVPAVFGFTQFVIEEAADKRAHQFERQKYEDEQLDAAAQQFLSADSYEKRMRVLQVLRGLQRNPKWARLTEALNDAFVREGQELAKNGEIDEIEAAEAEEVAQEVQQQVESYSEAVKQEQKAQASQNHDRVPLAAGKPKAVKVREFVRRQYVQIEQNPSCKEAVAGAITLKDRLPDYPYSVWRKHNGFCVLTIGGYTLEEAKQVAADWKQRAAEELRGKERNRYKYAYVTSESHLKERIYPKGK